MSRDEPRRPKSLDEPSRRAINRELGQARSALQAIRGLYLGMAFLTAIVLLAWFLPSASGELGPVGLTVLLSLIGLELTGAWRATREPVLWSVPPALVHSALVLVFYLDGLMRHWPVRITMWAVLLGLWSTVGLAWRAGRYLRQFPELRMARRLRGEVLAEEGATRRESRTRTRRSNRRFLAQGIAYGGTSALLIGLAVTLIFRADQPTDVGEALAAFREHWNASQLDEIGALFPAESRERLESRFRAWVRRRGWQDGLPALGDVEVESPDSTRVRAVLAMGEDTLETHWEWQQHRWNLRAFARRIGGGESGDANSQPDDGPE